MAALGQLWSRVLTGDGMRPSRLHSMSGKRIDLAGLRFLPHCVWSVLILKTTGRRLEAPWLGYRAVQRLRDLTPPGTRVIEFGSGMSSLFFSRRQTQLVSIETDADWYAKMRPLLTAVDYRLQSPTSNYPSLPDLEPHSFDLALVDGTKRAQEAAAAIRLVKPGGYILFDNSDVPYLDYKEARRTLLDAAEMTETFVDFYPFQIQANESLLVRLGDKIAQPRA